MRTVFRDALFWAFLVTQCTATVPDVSRSLSEHETLHLSAYATADNATSTDIQAARRIVDDAIARMTKLNKARLEKPNRNNFSLKPGTKIKREEEARSPLLKITDQIAQAAALLADIDANSTTLDAGSLHEKRAGTFWMETVGKARKGSVPWGNDASYRVILSSILPLRQ
jgi:N-acyl-D-aspartate/D-glutamate deacylase